MTFKWKCENDFDVLVDEIPTRHTTAWRIIVALLLTPARIQIFFQRWGGGGVQAYDISILKYQSINACKCIIPNMVRLGAHTSKVAFIQALITQWYWKWCLFEDCEQFCLMASQFMFLAAIPHDSESVGHRSTVRTVLADSMQDDKHDTFK